MDWSKRKKAETIQIGSSYKWLHKTPSLKLLILATLLMTLCLLKSAWAGSIEPQFENWKSFVIQGFISDLQDQPSHFLSLGDLAHIASSYEQLGQACESMKRASFLIDKIFADKRFVTCSHTILGAGDNGTTVWLEKYKRYHGRTSERIGKGQLPDVLMLAETLGSWGHDYTLAQPYSSLERGCNILDSSDYLFQQYLRQNPYANARHIFQSNLVNLAKTDAPYLGGIKVIRIERKNNHPKDWECPNHNYRLITQILTKEKVIYTDEIDICSGLGPPREIVSDKCSSKAEFDQLNQFSDEKGFTPIIDGDQFVLTGGEEKLSRSRVIVVYGGGGTAAACYRKAFFDHDRKKDGNSFERELSKNKVIWIAKEGFEAAGSGVLATKALETAKKRDELFVGELIKVRINAETGKLKLYFKPSSKNDLVKQADSEIECDQLIFAVGQDSATLKQVCAEFDSDLSLELNLEGMPLCVKSSDDKLHFFGAAAMAIRQKEYMLHTWKWLQAENIGPDVGPGSMSPSRAQVKQYLAQIGYRIEAVNVNMDSKLLIQQFFINAGIDSKTTSLLINDILLARTDSTSGFVTAKLQGFLDKYSLNDRLNIKGLSHLVVNHALLSKQVDKVA